jgi:hypothetical protein
VIEACPVAAIGRQAERGLLRSLGAERSPEIAALALRDAVGALQIPAGLDPRSDHLSRGKPACVVMD